MYTEEKYNDIDKLIASYLSNELDEKSFSELKRWSMESETNRTRSVGNLVLFRRIER